MFIERSSNIDHQVRDQVTVIAEHIAGHANNGSIILLLISLQIQVDF